MLAHLKYNPTVDTLFFAGDLLAKSTHSSSLSVLHFLTENHKINGTDRVFPVRGNHDQLVIQWRAWREWFEGLTLPLPASASSRSRVPFFFRNPLDLAFQVRSNYLSWFSVNDTTSLEGRMKARQAATPPVSTGKEFLQILDVEWALEKIEGEGDPEEYADVARKRSEGTWRESWWRRIPSPGKGKEDQQWRIFSDHYFLARLVRLQCLWVLCIDSFYCFQRHDTCTSILSLFSPSCKPYPPHASFRGTRRSSPFRP